MLDDPIPDPPMYYDRQGQPISLRRWAELREDRRYHRVAVSSLLGFYVSTVWLGLDHGGGGRLEIFETMIFREEDGRPELGEELWCRRYATEDRARAGHELAVVAVRLGQVGHQDGSA